MAVEAALLLSLFHRNKRWACQVSLSHVFAEMMAQVTLILCFALAVGELVEPYRTISHAGVRQHGSAHPGWSSDPTTDAQQACI